MITVKIKGGLGNQLFQYAYGRSKSIQQQTELELDLSWYANPYFDRRYLLSKFNICCETKTDGNNCEEGYWQSESFFKDIKHVITKDFTLKNQLDVPNKKAESLIKNCESPVCVHVRYGKDILIIPEFVKVCKPDYYHKRITHLASKVNNPVFFVFSDNFEWAKSNIGIKHPVHFMNNNDDFNCHLDLYLMSLCKHHIISASTFSWWSAWLSVNKREDGGMVIRPERYYVSGDMNETDLWPSSWEVFNDNR